MKKIRLTIVSIYIVILILITVLSITLVAQSFIKGINLYFKEPGKQKDELPSQSDIEKVIEILKEFNVIQPSISSP